MTLGIVRRMKRPLSLLLLCAACASASAAIVLTDDFAYADGVLTNVSNLKWRNHSGPVGEVNVVAGQLELTRDETEDVDAALLGAPYSSTGGNVLYARFTLTVTALPTGSSGNYFAHFNALSNPRAKVFATVNGARSGRFRLGIGNSGSSASTNWPVDLNLNQPYTVVTRLVLSNATATLWINPTSDADPSITGLDIAGVTSVSSFSWRQDVNMGVLAVDELVVATSFGEALSGNASPVISDIADQRLPAGASTGPIPFVIGDVETNAEALTVSAQIADTNLVPGIVFGGIGSNRTVTVSAPLDQSGTNIVTVLVTDGTTTNSDSFVLTIVPALLLADDILLFDGALIPSATPPWTHYSGTVTGEIQVVSGRMLLSGLWTEDVSVALPGGPFTTNSGMSLYASFNANFSQLPSSRGDYFAHFNTSSRRCRLFASTTNAAPGKFRFGVANAATAASAQWAADLAMNTNHFVVMRYNPATGMSTLWVNPVSEIDPGTNAMDIASGVTVSDFAFREDPGIGTFTVDEVRVGFTFGAVVGVSVPPLRIQVLTSDTVLLAWPVSAVGFTLQSNSNTDPNNWQDAGLTLSVVGNENVVTLPMTDSMFFRLKK